VLGDEVNDLSLPLHRPRQPSIPAERISRRWRSNTEGQTIRLATLVSSSIVMNRTPLAEPGFCRTSTRPATVSRRPSRACLRSARDTIRWALRSDRRKARGCWRRVSPCERYHGSRNLITVSARA
jgi:hypothetical protein